MKYRGVYSELDLMFDSDFVKVVDFDLSSELWVVLKSELITEIRWQLSAETEKLGITTV